MAKKSKKLLPKQLGGMKIEERPTRRGGDFLSSPTGQRMLAEGLLMVGASGPRPRGPPGLGLPRRR